MSDTPVRALTITGCKKVYTGKNKDGDEYSIYKVQATDEHGQVINQDLRSFEDLEIGYRGRFKVERYDGGDRGISYTLKQVREKLGPRVRKIEEEMPKLKRRIEHLERTMGVQPSSDTPAPEPKPAPIDNERTARFGGDDDIPF